MDRGYGDRHRGHSPARRARPGLPREGEASWFLRAGHIADVLPLAVREPIELRWRGRAREILTRHADECPGEIRQPRRARLIGEDAGVELLRKPLPPSLLHAIREAQPLVVHFNAEFDRHTFGDGDRRCERVRGHLIGKCRHHTNMFAAFLVARDVEVVELGAVVVAHETGHLLEVLRFELHDRRRAVAMRLLTTGDERLPEEAADCLATVKAEVPLPLAEAEQLVRPWL